MFKEILFPVDVGDKDSWAKALPVALDLVKTYGATLHVMTVVPDFGMSIVSQYFADNAEEQMLEAATKSVHAFVDEHIPADVKTQCIVSQGTVYKCIVETGKSINADVIVMSAHRPELKQYLLGPNAAKVVRHAELSVLVVR